MRCSAALGLLLVRGCWVYVFLAESLDSPSIEQIEPRPEARNAGCDV